MDTSNQFTQIEICRFDNPVLRGAPSPLFRRSADDGVPVLVMRMGDRDAVMPLRGVQREFGIRDDSHDGLMLARVEEALDFVQEIRPGDAFPAEITSGEASWQADPIHRHIAAQRVRQQLIQWLGAMDRPEPDPSHGLSTARDRAPAFTDAQLQQMFRRIAEALGLADARNARQLIEALIAELALIEALRERLLGSLRIMARKLDAISQDRRGEGDNLEMLTQIRRLCRVALARIGQRFAEVDDSAANLANLLNGWEAQRVFLRSNRDWLYRSHRAFDPVLREWERAPTHIDGDFWNRLGRSYRFLAPRFMVVQEWRQPDQPGWRRKPVGPRIRW